MASGIQQTRRQLSMYVPGNAAAEIEAVRRTLDPIQSHLIPAHVTLCREDELNQISESELLGRLSNIQFEPIILHFGRIEVFSGHGMLLTCIAGESDFYLLREHLLGSTAIRTHKPHITLAHPRNPKSPQNSLANTSHLPAVISIAFPTIYLIEQDGSQPWRLIEKFDLHR